MKTDKCSTYFEENFDNGCSIFRNSWLLDKKIRYELPLLLTIAYLNKTGVCTAKNKWFSKTLGMGINWVSKSITKLNNEGYIEVLYKKKGNNIEERYIKLLK